MVEFQQHPATGQQLVGTRLPHWQELRRVNDACARRFAPVRYQSLDIALTDSGPEEVEVNVGGSFVMPSSATGQGLHPDATTDVLPRSGWKAARRRCGSTRGCAKTTLK